MGASFPGESPAVSERETRKHPGSDGLPGNPHGAGPSVLRSPASAETSLRSILSFERHGRIACGSSPAPEFVPYRRLKIVTVGRFLPPSSRLLRRVHQIRFDLRRPGTSEVCPRRAATPPRQGSRGKVAAGYRAGAMCVQKRLPPDEIRLAVQRPSLRKFPEECAGAVLIGPACGTLAIRGLQ